MPCLGNRRGVLSAFAIAHAIANDAKRLQSLCVERRGQRLLTPASHVFAFSALATAPASQAPTSCA